MSDNDSLPDNQPNLMDSEVSRKTVLIGFSYSLAPDGSPGSYNTDIANSIWKDFLNSSKTERPCIGMQWEIYDSLEENEESSGQISNTVPHAYVAAPPRFNEADILDLGGLLGWLRRSEVPTAQALLERVPSILKVENDKKELLSLFDRLLYDRTLYEAFQPVLELCDLSRPDKGLIGLEKRILPEREKYPYGLRRFQTQRVNRLIIETVLSDSMLQRGKYLNTKQVADQILSQAMRDGREIEHCVIYAHPEHRWWCRKNLLDSMAGIGWKSSDIKTHFGDTKLFWDSNSAQVWCRSKENWELYKRS